MAHLQQSVAAEGLDLFLVSAEESILYLAGVSYTPLERPFLILVRPRGQPELLVPMLERDHLAQAAFKHKAHAFWDYPSPAGQGWAERLDGLIGSARALAVEPTLPSEVLQVLVSRRPAILPLVERLRLIKSPAEIEMLRHAARICRPRRRESPGCGLRGGLAAGALRQGAFRAVTHATGGGL
jgi:Xaa-Pro aminopeptidase